MQRLFNASQIDVEDGQFLQSKLDFWFWWCLSHLIYASHHVIVCSPFQIAAGLIERNLTAFT